jgi:hypothetical protein
VEESQRRRIEMASKYDGLVNTIHTNIYGDKYIITKVDSASCIHVKFLDEYHYETHTQYEGIAKCRIKNIFGKHVYGVGYIGNTTTKNSDDNRQKYSYEVWNKMLQRCYDDKTQLKFPTYKGCKVCEEWLSYENFEKWFNDNYPQDKNHKYFLDKDLLSSNNKIYSPNTCCFIPRIINNAIAYNRITNNSGYNGVCYDKKSHKYMAQISYNNNRHALGWFDNPYDAFICYKNAKEEYIHQLAKEYGKYLSCKAYNALINYKIKEN